MSAEPPNSTAHSPVFTPCAHARRLRVRILAFVGVLALVVGAAYWWTTGSDTSRKDALIAANEGRFSEAEVGLKAALARNTNDHEVVEALARGYLKAENSVEAETYLSRWVELRPDDRDARRFLFEFYRKAKNLEKAYPHGRHLLELEPGDAKLRNSLMGQAFSTARFEEAEGYCQALLRSQPNDRDLRSMSAQIRRARGDMAGACAVLDQLLKDVPNYTPTMLLRGIYFIESGQPAEAAPLLREVLKNDRQRQRQAGYHLAIALERVGDREGADRVTAQVRRLQDVANAEEAIRNQPDNLDLPVRLGEELLTAGHTQDGLRLVESVLAVAPTFAPAHKALANHYERAGEPAKAAEHRRRAGP